MPLLSLHPVSGTLVFCDHLAEMITHLLLHPLEEKLLDSSERGEGMKRSTEQEGPPSSPKLRPLFSPPTVSENTKKEETMMK
uniref:Uncharacterized protein n=1 Tax=Caenorhabditis tropicalis TaxID=1561998 RepID=A0A1I7URU6_9PELO